MQPSMTEIIHHPGPDDVLCGRGGATNNHQGNRRFRDLVHAHQAEYLAAKKRDKRVIARAIVSIILRERGGRFLKKVGDGAYGGGGGGGEDLWYDVGEKKATEKTSQALREGLDARSLAAKGIRVPVHVLQAQQHRRRAVVPSTESSSSDEQHEPPRKRRRTNGHGPASPALVSEIDRNNKIAPADGFSLGYGGYDEPAMAATYPNDTVEVACLADAPPPSAEDVGEIVAL